MFDHDELKKRSFAWLETVEKISCRSCRRTVLRDDLDVVRINLCIIESMLASAATPRDFAEMEAFVQPRLKCAGCGGKVATITLLKQWRNGANLSAERMAPVPQGFWDDAGGRSSWGGSRAYDPSDGSCDVEYWDPSS